MNTKGVREYLREQNKALHILPDCNVREIRKCLNGETHANVVSSCHNDITVSFDTTLCLYDYIEEVTPWKCNP